ncbi:DNA-directed DNA polymerase gamma mip1 [Dispira simplex]|nr:DNA-directed DNA polymerase gamma mip1 [Dispira simplex]
MLPAARGYLGRQVCAPRPWPVSRAFTFIRSRCTQATTPSIRQNALGIQMLPPQLYQGVFSSRRFSEPTPQQIQIAQDHLRQHGLGDKKATIQTPVDFTPPTLQGNTIQEHFYQLGTRFAEPFLSMAKRAVNATLLPIPDQWQLDQPGWVRYPTHGLPTPVTCPLEPTLVFDVEVLFLKSPYPVLACAASEEAWYLWLSPYLTRHSEHDCHLIPLNQDKKPRVIIGHNVGFDRVRVADEYHLQASGNIFLDTMSFHCAVSGLSTQQRIDWMFYKKHTERKPDPLDLDEDGAGGPGASYTTRRKIADLHRLASVGSSNSLKEVAKLHCKLELDKDPRDLFFQGDINMVRDNLHMLTTYCAKDVVATHRVYQQLFPKYLAKCPHPASFVGITEIIGAMLPVTEKWEQFFQHTEAMFQDMVTRIEQKLTDLAENALREANTAMQDLWLRHLDWTIAPIRMTKPKYRKDGTYAPGGEPRPHARQSLPGKPQWYKSVWDRKAGRIRVTTRTRVTPYLLKLQWQGYPLYYSDTYGWTYRVPHEDTHKIHQAALDFPTDPQDEAYEEYPAEDTSGCYFRIPHQDGETARCLNPLAKGYIAAFEEGILTSEYEAAQEALQLSAQCSYWISCRERIRSQLVIWDDCPPEGVTGLGMPPTHPSPGGRRGILLPQVVPMGTITRRAVESTWMTASNAKRNRLGSELKAMVEAPPGYCLVGADVDSEELWISSLIGDSQFRTHGSTALGWMNLQGTKADGTDMHSNTATIMSISRNNAKIFNYGRIYGAGVKFATQLLLKFNPTMAEEQAVQTARKLYSATKGSQLKCPSELKFPPVTLEPAVADGAQTTRSTAASPRLDTIWCGGSESFMFNSLEAVALLPHPRTPALGCEISDTLLPRIAKSKYMTSRINWVVQSSGVDYLHLLIVSMKYLVQKYNIQARFMISIHDEIRYLVKSEDRYRAAMALQIANLWTRALFSYRLGMEDLPWSVAFFSLVDIDHVLRKEVDDPCVTPSHPEPIPAGESVTIQDLVELAPLSSEKSMEERPHKTNAATDDTQLATSSRSDSTTTSANSSDFRYLLAQMTTNRADLHELYTLSSMDRKHNSDSPTPAARKHTARSSYSSIRVIPSSERHLTRAQRVKQRSSKS